MNRAQSEVVSNVLLAGLVVLGVTAVGVAVVGSIDTGGSPLAELDETGPPETIEIAHLGGEPLTNDSARILIRNESSSVAVAVSDGAVNGAPGADRVAPGDVWEYDVDEAELSGSRLEVVVVVDDEAIFRAEKPIG
ncbi:type IV pilin [Halorubrum trueperi]|uniref:Type IV pilin n=1 Tax=Halorubrum trueperi TaxID=2004704 RepID=A0ABD5UK82_9EURY